MGSPSEGITRKRGGDDFRVLKSSAKDPANSVRTSAPLLGREVLDRLIEAIPGVNAFLTDAQGIITSQSPAIEKSLGYAPADTIGHPITRFLADGNEEAGQEILSRLLEYDRAEVMGVSVRTRDGRILERSLTARILKGYDGKIAGIAGIISDDGQAGMIIENLRQEVEHLGALVDFSMDAILELDEQNRIKAWSQGAERLFGYRKSEVLGTGLSSIFPDLPSRRAFLDSSRNCIEETEPPEFLEIPAVNKNGHGLYVRTKWIPQLNDEGGILRKTAVISDITELRRLKIAESRAERLSVMGRMAANIAHEIKNPINSIRLNLEMIDSELNEIADKTHREESCQTLRSVKDELDRLEKTLRAYLQFIRAPQIQPQRSCIKSTIIELQRFMKKEMQSKDIVLENDFSPGIPHIYMDENRLREAILNIYRNSVDAMPDGGTIETVAFLSGGLLEIQISDTGSGVSEDMAERLFEPFVSSKASGTGLGLSISKDIIEAHGGTIASAPNAGEGTTFTIKLPKEQ